MNQLRSPELCAFFAKSMHNPHNSCSVRRRCATKICRRGHLLLNGRHLNNLLHDLSETDHLSAASTDSELRPYGAAALVWRRGEVGAPLLKGQKPARKLLLPLLCLHPSVWAQKGQMNTSLEGTIYKEITLVSVMSAGFPNHKFLPLQFLWFP